MAKAVHQNTTIAESPAPVMLEGNAYFPPDSVNWSLLEASATPYTCPWKGDCTYYDVVVDGQRLKDAAWSYRQPKPAAAAIAGHVAFLAQLNAS